MRVGATSILASLVLCLVATGRLAAADGGNLDDLRNIVVGPLVRDCETTACFTLLDTLEETSATGMQVGLGAFKSAEYGDYLYGTLDSIGVIVDDSLRTEFETAISQAQAQYDLWLAQPSVTTEELPGPPQLDKLPPALRQEMIGYARQGAGAACSVAVKALRAARTQQTDAVDPNPSLLLLLQANYRFRCLDRLGSVDPAFDHLVFFLDGMKVSCAGVLLAKNLVLTARHCFAPGERSWVSRFLITGKHSAPLSVREVPGRQAIVLGDRGASYRAVPANLPFNLDLEHYDPISERGSDYLLIELVDYNKTLTPLPVGQPTLGAKVVIPAFLGDTSALRDPASAAAAEGSLRVDNSPLCSVLAVVGKCLIHTCQTDGGYSGTPILQKQGDRYVVVGVHTGTFASDVEPACGFSRGSFFRNYGVEIDVGGLNETIHAPAEGPR